MMELKELSRQRVQELRAFAQYLDRNRRAEGTSKKYLPAVAHFLDYIGDRAPGSLGRGELEVYFDDWHRQFVDRNGRRPAAATYRGHVNALKVYFAFLDDRELLGDAEGVVTRNRMAAITTP